MTVCAMLKKTFEICRILITFFFFWSLFNKQVCINYLLIKAYQISQRHWAEKQNIGFVGLFCLTLSLFWIDRASVTKPEFLAFIVTLIGNIFIAIYFTFWVFGEMKDYPLLWMSNTHLRHVRHNVIIPIYCQSHATAWFYISPNSHGTF